MALPLGKKSLLQIERRSDPHRRVVELMTLLEWLLRLVRPPRGELPEDASLTTVMRSYANDPQTAEQLGRVVAIRERLVHCIPGLAVVTKKEAQQAADVLGKAIRMLIQKRISQRPSVPHTEEAANDPLHEIELLEDREVSETCPRASARVRGVLCRLDTLSGYRAPFDSEGLSPRQIAASLMRHHRYVSDVPVDAVHRALSATSSTEGESLLARAADNLQRAYESLSAFDAEWETAGGAPPLGAIALEPDVQSRLRLLGTLVEHQLAWIGPALSPEQGETLVEQGDIPLFETLLNDKGHLVPDVDDLQTAWDVRTRLLRVVPSGRPVTSLELDESERTLSRAAFELRRHCHMEHADALSDFADTPLGTLPCSVLTEIHSVESRLCEMLRRLESLALTWEGHHPGCWSVPTRDDLFPSPLQVLRRHARPDVVDRLETVNAARKYFQRRADQGASLRPLPEIPGQTEWQNALTSVIDILEHELSWQDRPHTDLPQRKRPPPPPPPAEPRSEPSLVDDVETRSKPPAPQSTRTQPPPPPPVATPIQAAHARQPATTSSPPPPLRKQQQQGGILDWVFRWFDD